MKKHNCMKNLEYYTTIDECLAFGNIVSMAVYKCKICDREFLEGEIFYESGKNKRINSNKRK